MKFLKNFQLTNHNHLTIQCPLSKKSRPLDLLKFAGQKQWQTLLTSRFSKSKWELLFGLQRLNLELQWKSNLSRYIMLSVSVIRVLPNILNSSGNCLTTRNTKCSSKFTSIGLKSYQWRFLLTFLKSSFGIRICSKAKSSFMLKINYFFENKFHLSLHFHMTKFFLYSLIQQHLLLV